MSYYGKKARRKLRELAGSAYERELDQELAKLHEEFEKWRNKEMDCFELSDLIHEFHNGVSRDLWKTYNYSDPDMAVSRAIALGILSKDEIPQELLDQVLPRTRFFEPEIEADEDLNEEVEPDRE